MPVSGETPDTACETQALPGFPVILNRTRRFDVSDSESQWVDDCVALKGHGVTPLAALRVSAVCVPSVGHRALKGQIVVMPLAACP